MRFVLVAAALLATSFTVRASDCVLPKLAPGSQIPKTFIYDKGWKIPGLERASIVGTHQEDDGSTRVDYKPTENVEVDLQGFELSANGKTLQLVPGYVQLVTDIQEFRVQDRSYAYSVITVSLGHADPPMWRHIRSLAPRKIARKGSAQSVPGGVLGCGWTVLRYFDADGDGSFESMEYIGFGGPHTNSTACPTTPVWALALLPNRAAAESCVTARRAIGLDLTTGEVPQALKYILDYRPADPVLVPKN